MVGVAVVLVAACGSGDDEGRSDDPLDDTGRAGYVAAFSTAHPEGDDVTDAQKRCLAEAVVDGVGVRQLQAAGTPRELVEWPGGAAPRLASSDVEIGEEERDAIYDAAQDCLDLRDRFVAGAAPGLRQLPSEVVDCVKANLDDDLLREIVLTQLTAGDAEAATDSDFAKALATLGYDCSMLWSARAGSPPRRATSPSVVAVSDR